MRWCVLVTCAASDGHAVDQKGIPRVGSVGRLELTGGSSWQLLQRFVLKTAALVAVVRAISIAPPGTIVLDALWGTHFQNPPPQLKQQQSNLRSNQSALL